MKRYAIALILAFATLISGCASSRVPLTAKPVVYGTNLMANVKPQLTAAGQMKADSTAFAIELLKKTYDGKNTVVSPVSAYLALSMVANGAKGETLKEFENVLGAPLADLDSTCKALMDALNVASNGLTLKTVNGIWYNTKYNFKPNAAFLQTNADYFGAAAIASDFSNPATLNAINRFVSDNTNTLIPSILDELEGDAVMVLVNSLYFNGKWASPFKAEKTDDQSFTTAENKKVLVKTMDQTYNSIRYIDSGDSRGIILPYKDSRFAYMAILPSGGVMDYLPGLTADRFRLLVKSATDKKVELTIPKYKATNNFKLVDTLSNMGLRSAFDMYKADLSALGTAGINNIYIDKAIQKIIFKLDEDGTEAAAVSAVQASAAGLPMKQPELYYVLIIRSSMRLWIYRPGRRCSWA